MTDSCGNPNDTGQQLMAANIGYDNTVTQLAAAHVQAAIDILANQTGLNYHPNFNGRELDDQHPQSAITGLIAELAGKAQTNHTQAGTTVSYDQTLVNLLGSVDTQSAIDELAVIQNAGVYEYAAIADEVVPLEGIAASFNQMDWTGHEHADATITTALNIQANHIVTCGNNTATAYRWVGAKPVLLGVGSGYVATDSEFQAVGTADHSALVNRNLVDQHTMDAVTGLVAALLLKIEDAPIDGLEYLRKDGLWAVPTSSQEYFTGFKNVLVNPNGLVNQPDFDGNWGITANYGYDMWYKTNATHKAQLIEDSALRDGMTYTLSWTSLTGEDGVIVAGDGSTTSGQSPLTMVGMNLGVADQTRVELPFDAKDCQLERGVNQTDFEVRNIQMELALCQRHFYRHDDIGTVWVYATAGTAKAWGVYILPVVMRTNPTRTVFSEPQYSNASAVQLGGKANILSVYCAVTATGQFQVRNGVYDLDARLQES